MKPFARMSSECLVFETQDIVWKAEDVQLMSRTTELSRRILAYLCVRSWLRTQTRCWQSLAMRIPSIAFLSGFKFPPCRTSRAILARAHSPPILLQKLCARSAGCRTRNAMSSCITSSLVTFCGGIQDSYLLTLVRPAHWDAPLDRNS